jgi:hypothetical protein
MPRKLRGREVEKIARTKRTTALERAEFRYPSEARVAADSPTSFAVKAADPQTSSLVEEFLAKRRKA